MKGIWIWIFFACSRNSAFMFCFLFFFKEHCSAKLPFCWNCLQCDGNKDYSILFTSILWLITRGKLRKPAIFTLIPTVVWVWVWIWVSTYKVAVRFQKVGVPGLDAPPTPLCLRVLFPSGNYSYDNELKLSHWPFSQSAVTCLSLFRDDLLSKIRTLRVSSFVCSCIIIPDNASALCCCWVARQSRLPVCQAAQEGRQVGINGALTGRWVLGETERFHSRCAGHLPHAAAKSLGRPPPLSWLTLHMAVRMTMESLWLNGKSQHLCGFVGIPQIPTRIIGIPEC